MTAFLEGDDAGYNARQERDMSGGTAINPPPVNTYLAEIEEFRCALLEKREPSNCYKLGLHSQKVLEACYKSAKTGKIIDIQK